MESGIFQLCPNCLNSYDLHGPVFILPADPLNEIYVCNVCGLVYKPILNYDKLLSTEVQYTKETWNEFRAAHQERLNKIARRTTEEAKISSNDFILDVGAGIGILFEELSKIIPGMTKYFAVEPVYDIALHLKTNHPSIFVLNSDMGGVQLPGGRFKIIYVCGVDYLFRDIRRSFEKIYSLLAEDGIVVIQRNVFIDQEGYVGEEIVTLMDMFAKNAIMRNWFHSEQYVDFVSQFFKVRDMWKETQYFPRKEGGEFKSFIVNLICEKLERKSERTGTGVKSYRDINIQHLEKLRSNIEKISNNNIEGEKKKGLLKRILFKSS